MIKICQRDPRWSQITLGQTPFTIGRWGCTTCCLSMLSDYFDCYYSPDELAKTILQYTKDGLIVWKSVNKMAKMQFEKRLFGQCNHEEIQKSLKDPKKAVILEVEGKHWVLATSKIPYTKTYWIIDPWTGTKKTTMAYKNKITGSAHFSSKF